MMLIDGKKIAEEIRTNIKREVAERIQLGLRPPGLALLLIGNNSASEVYVGAKDKACIEAGIYSEIVRLPETATQSEVIAKVEEWNNNDRIDGILVQLPLPKHIDENSVIMAINPDKDVDGFHPVSAGRLMIGLPGFLPCTPAGILELLIHSNIETKGKHVVVVGRSNIVGKPIANLMAQKRAGANAIVTLCHTGTKDITYYTRQADILIMAVGVPNLIKSQDIKEGVVIIDVGMNRIPDSTTKSGTRLVGDVDFHDVKQKCSAITPVPGGVGPMTIAMLLSNTLRSVKGNF